MSKRETKLRTKQSTIIRLTRKCFLTASVSTTFCLFIRCSKIGILNEISSMIMIQFIVQFSFSERRKVSNVMIKEY